MADRYEEHEVELAGLTGPEGLTRKQFLFGAGAMVVTFGLAQNLLAQVAGAASAPTTPTPTLNTWAAPAGRFLGNAAPLASWVAVTANGQVLIGQSQPDPGTGAQTGMLQIAADELYVPFSQIAMMAVNTTSPNTGGVGGSTGVRASGSAVRIAAATARENLRALAATALGVAAGQLTPRSGAFYAPNGKSVTYAELVKGKQLTGSINPNVPLKSPKDYTVVGTSVPRIDIPVKLTGAGGPTDYLVNQRIPGMVHARLLRPPAYGAPILSYDATKVLKMRDVIAVVPLDFSPDHIPGWNQGISNLIQGQFLAVVAKTEWAAIQGVATLAQSTKWGEGNYQIPQPASNTYEYLATLPVFEKLVATARGSMPKGFAQAKKVVTADYSVPYLANAPIGPSTAVAYVQPDKVEIWSDGQNVWSTQSQVAAMLGLPTTAVTVQSYPGSGVYGRGNVDDAAFEAAMISKAVGLPVRVQWMRQEEFEWSTMQGPKYFKMRAGLDGKNDVAAFQFDVYSDKDFGNGWIGQNGIAVAPLYTFPHLSQVIHYGQNPMRKGLLRAVGGPSNAFAVESFMDELAYAAGVDPLEYRLRQLSDPRMIKVLQAAAAKAGWKSHTRPTGRGMGIATFFDPGSQTYVADVAQVAVDKSTGKVQLQKFHVGFDCGLVVNPSGVRLQIEGGTIQSASWAMKESVLYKNGMVDTVDWISYPILHFSEVPQVVPVIVDRPDVPPGGVGELGTLPVAPAIANAIYDATGVRVRNMPFTPQNVKAALAQA